MNNQSFIKKQDFDKNTSLDKLYILGILLILSVYAFFFLKVSSGFGPYYGDEVFYQKNSESYFQSKELRASFTYSGKGSKIGAFDAHGPSYPIIYGTALKLGIPESMHIPLVNYFLFFIAILLLVWQNRRQPYKFLQVILILGSPYTLFYAFSFMPELIHLAIAIGLYLLLTRYLKEFSRWNLVVLILGIFLAGLIRSTWFFTLLALGFYFLPKKIWFGISLSLVGLVSAFLYASFFHEQTPTVFSNAISFLKSGEFGSSFHEIYFNTKRNIYFFLTYSEGKYYWGWKIWVLVSLALGIGFLKRNQLIRISTYLLLIQLIFSIVLYKTYEWTDWRMLSSVTILLNLGIIEYHPFKLRSKLMVGISLLSFLLILPFQHKVISLRNDYTPTPIGSEIISNLKDLNHALVRVDSSLLADYDLESLPTINFEGKLIRYILPYYSVEEVPASHFLEKQENQLMIRSVKILPQ
ncbi:hypothetical protein E4S40_00920 [Algoriphagus kandeliae]|uniref:Glycosyltransferase RgtA/B/C/D-like domain-containing protein n=1 Tax=Algoriphagus kandeliae TaxID=2562278 RepID=A0A4Y9QYX4_9BACT|nr:hypothetical protein [Algoriphagus kandeliae]TFV97250.1 hypothetical protein E4S40_00920 [Algoriphagus kandeliae]